MRNSLEEYEEIKKIREISEQLIIFVRKNYKGISSGTLVSSLISVLLTLYYDCDVTMEQFFELQENIKKKYALILEKKIKDKL